MIHVGFEDDDRYDRMRRFEWMDIDRIQSARCMVVGAGALGNEVIKDMVLAGFKRITVVDMDDIVPSNLSRCLWTFSSHLAAIGLPCKFYARLEGRSG